MKTGGPVSFRAIWVVNGVQYRKTKRTLESGIMLWAGHSTGKRHIFSDLSSVNNSLREGVGGLVPHLPLTGCLIPISLRFLMCKREGRHWMSWSGRALLP